MQQHKNEQQRPDNNSQNQNPAQPNRDRGNDQLNTNAPANNEQSSNDDYRREGAQLGATSSGTAQSTGSGFGTNKPEEGASSPGAGNNPQQLRDASGPHATKQSGGGASGYDVNREMEPIKEERENMGIERDQDDLQTERTQTPRPETDPGREHPQRENPQPDTPQTNPGSSTGGVNPNSVH